MKPLTRLKYSNLTSTTSITTSARRITFQTRKLQLLLLCLRLCWTKCLRGSWTPNRAITCLDSILLIIQSRDHHSQLLSSLAERCSWFWNLHSKLSCATSVCMSLPSTQELSWFWKQMHWCVNSLMLPWLHSTKWNWLMPRILSVLRVSSSLVNMIKKTVLLAVRKTIYVAVLLKQTKMELRAKSTCIRLRRIKLQMLTGQRSENYTTKKLQWMQWWNVNLLV